MNHEKKYLASPISHDPKPLRSCIADPINPSLLIYRTSSSSLFGRVRNSQKVQAPPDLIPSNIPPPLALPANKRSKNNIAFLHVGSFTRVQSSFRIACLQALQRVGKGRVTTDVNCLHTGAGLYRYPGQDVGQTHFLWSFDRIAFRLHATVACNLNDSFGLLRV